MVPKERDIVSWLLNPDDEEIPLQLNADARLLVVAGRYVLISPVHVGYYGKED